MEPAAASTVAAAALLADGLPTLRTARLELRQVGDADVPALFRIFADPEVTRYWSSPPLADMAAARELLQSIQDGLRTRTLLEWGVTWRETGEVVGTCTLARLDFQHRRAELGFAVGRAHWGRGVAGEAVPAVLRFGFAVLGLHRVEADVDPRNAPSIRVLERQGFRREGHLRERYHLLGEVQDALLFGLLRAEWEHNPAR